jgi:hypothetical protein
MESASDKISDPCVYLARSGKKIFDIREIAV